MLASATLAAESFLQVKDATSQPCVVLSFNAPRDTFAPALPSAQVANGFSLDFWTSVLTPLGLDGCSVAAKGAADYAVATLRCDPRIALLTFQPPRHHFTAQSFC